MVRGNNMKKMLLLLISLLVLLVGCTEQFKQSRQAESSKQSAHEENEIDFRTGIYYEKFWDTERLEDSDYCVIPDEEAAVKIATAIYQELPIRTYAAQAVFYDEEDEVWIVKFYYPIPETGPAPTDQPVHSIALQKKDGKVLSIRVN